MNIWNVTFESIDTNQQLKMILLHDDGPSDDDPNAEKGLRYFVLHFVCTFIIWFLDKFCCWSCSNNSLHHMLNVFQTHKVFFGLQSSPQDDMIIGKAAVQWWYRVPNSPALPRCRATSMFLCACQCFFYEIVQAAQNCVLLKTVTRMFISKLLSRQVHRFDNAMELDQLSRERRNESRKQQLHSFIISWNIFYEEHETWGRSTRETPFDPVEQC